jgi:hypothetical protein
VTDDVKAAPDWYQPCEHGQTDPGNGCPRCLKRRLDAMTRALEAAARSLDSIWMGRAENNPESESDLRWQVREYAKSRADVARAALREDGAPICECGHPLEDHDAPGCLVVGPSGEHMCECRRPA